MDDLTSADQDAWLDLARAIRSQAIKSVSAMGAMKPEEMKAFVEMAKELFWLEQVAATYDHRLSLERAKTLFDCDD